MGSTVKYPIPVLAYVVEPIPYGSHIKVTLDAGVPAGTKARDALVAPGAHLYQLKLLRLVTDAEVVGRVFSVVEGVEALIVELDEGREVEVDVDELIGALFVETLVLEAEAKVRTTSSRTVTLYYSGSAVKRW
ncbi:MAG: hypothetical protein QXU69_04560 [Thermofilaceae archaeon]